MVWVKQPRIVVLMEVMVGAHITQILVDGINSLRMEGRIQLAEKRIQIRPASECVLVVRIDNYALLKYTTRRQAKSDCRAGGDEMTFGFANLAHCFYSNFCFSRTVLPRQAGAILL